MSERIRCELCGEEKPAGAVDARPLEEGPPIDVVACGECRCGEEFLLAPDAPEGCLICGGDADGLGFELSLEHPVGDAGLPLEASGQLCEKCSRAAASRLRLRAAAAAGGDDELLAIAHRTDHGPLAAAQEDSP